MTPLRYFILLPLALLAACAGSPQAPENSVPDWVLATPDDPRYAYGVGAAPLQGDQAGARHRATEQARGDLIQNLRVTVAGETRSWIERVRHEDDGPVTRGFFQEVRTRIPPTTLDELEVAEAVLDRGEDTIYVLVRLDRPMATLRLSTELSRIRDQLAGFEARPRSGESRLERIRRLRPALELIARAGQIEDQLRLVSRQPLTARPVAESHADLLRLLSETLDELRIAVDESGLSERVLAGLRGGLLAQGLRVGGDEAVDLVIGGDVSLRHVAREPDHFVFAEGRISVYSADGRLLGQFRHQAREASSHPDLAEDRALNRLGETLGQALGEHLIGFL